MSEFEGDSARYGNDAKYPLAELRWGFNLQKGLTKKEAYSMLNCLRRELDSRGFYSGEMQA